MQKYKYYWHCSWDNGKGGFDPDYEGCSRKGRACNSPLSAATKGLKHVQIHPWSRWGHPPFNEPNWRDHYVYVTGERKTPTGKVKTISCGMARDIVKSNNK